ncbi:flagellar export protein FliJ [Anatilimnocola floriformis]|uniref:flagellar export protein FliJ n=1 Tax=Anatilimnocola floriformis TaxID=2948575 RepID=UPI0020C41C4E|nr:flagellar export protein FliJ [Anatilimnocola floriformis]
MSTYRFRLQTVLRLRSAARDERRAELGRAQRASEVLREQQDKVAADIVSTQDATRELLQKQANSTGGLNVDSLLNANRNVMMLRAQAAQLVQQQKQIAVEIGKRQAALVEADRDVRVLEKLQEKGLKEHEFRENAIEQRELDEIAIVRAFRQREVT